MKHANHYQNLKHAVTHETGYDDDIVRAKIHITNQQFHKNQIKFL